LCLEDATGLGANDISCEQAESCPESKKQNDPFALVPSFLQGHTSIDIRSLNYPGRHIL